MNQLPRRITQAEFRSSPAGQILLTLISLFALAATFLLDGRELAYTLKLTVFAAIIVIYLGCCAGIYFGSRKRRQIFKQPEDDTNTLDVFNSEIESRLAALEAANQFFGASLKPHDMFRLAASRVAELVPFSTCILLIDDESEMNLKTIFAEGVNADFFKGLNFDRTGGLAGKTIAARAVQTDCDLALESDVLPASALKNLSSAIAVPLIKNSKVFGVLELFGDQKTNFDENSRTLLEAVGERIAPLFANSLTFEKNMSNALTDALTNLPNERAFFLVLENQIAESLRFPEERPLSVLTIDLKNFTEVNQKFGFATGDRVLTFAGEIIKQQLRQMDFLARSSGDDFLAVLPTASEKIASEIIFRIERALMVKTFGLSGGIDIKINLNFGTASFGKDGETAQRLLAVALLKKQQQKSVEPHKVLWFPTEMVG